MKFPALSMVAIVAGLTLLPNMAANAASHTSISKKQAITVSVTYSITVPGDTSTVENSTKLQEIGRRTIYSMAQKECVIILETIAESCSMTRISVQSRNYRRRRNQTSDGIRMSGSASYRVQPK